MQDILAGYTLVYSYPIMPLIFSHTPKTSERDYNFHLYMYITNQALSDHYNTLYIISKRMFSIIIHVQRQLVTAQARSAKIRSR